MAKVRRRGANVRKDIEAITNAIVDNADRIRIATFNTVKGQMARRIFNEGKDSDGSDIGQYSVLTKKFRNLVGRRIDKVDLEMSGTLRRSLLVGTSDGVSVIGIADTPEPSGKASKRRKKGFATLQVRSTSKGISTEENAINQEQHFKKDIFAPSEEEIKRGESTIIKEINLIVKRS